MTVGSVPPEWGGQTMGGVAAMHRAIAEAIAQRQAELDATLIGIVPTNRPPACDGKPPAACPLLQPPQETRAQRAWYHGELARLRPDITLFFHLGHRWPAWHVETDMPFVGAIRSWHAITFATPERAERATALLQRVVPRAAALIFPSRHTLDEGIALGMPYPRALHVIPNPVQPAFVAAARQGLNAPPPERPKVAVVGSLVARKRIDMVLRAVAALGLEVVVIGDGEDRRQLQQLAIDLGLHHRAQFVGEIPARDVARHLLSCSVMCLPSASESFGNVYLEALACGVPVVGFAPTFAEIQHELGLAIGQPVAGNAPQEEVTAALAAVLATDYDRALLARRVAERCAVASIAARYAHVLKAAAAGQD